MYLLFLPKDNILGISALFNAFNICLVSIICARVNITNVVNCYRKRRNGNESVIFFIFY